MNMMLNSPTTDAAMSNPQRDGNDIPDLCRQLETVLRGILSNDGVDDVYSATGLAWYRGQAKAILEKGNQ